MKSLLVLLAAVATPIPAASSTSGRPTLVVVGGGAAGFFGAIRAASQAPSLRVLLLEASPRCLTKVSISGGGRCNVCHDETKDVRTLAAGYPRGERALLGTFSKRFGATDAAAWFRERGVELKTEADGRMFPTSDDSSTIVRSLTDAADEAGVEVCTRAKVTQIQLCDQGGGSDGDGDDGDGGGGGVGDGGGARFEVTYKADAQMHAVECRSLLFATGGSREAWELLGGLGVRMVSPVPSLFTLDLGPNDVTAGLAGVSVPEALVRLKWLPEASAGGGSSGGGGSNSGSNGGSSGGGSGSATGGKGKARRRRGGGAAFESRGPCLITHKGLSGPACLRLSAFAARELAEHQYQAEVSVSWVPDLNEEQAVEALRSFCARSPNKAAGGYSPVGLPRRLWANLVLSAAVDPAKPWAQLSKGEIRRIAQAVVATKLRSVGKSTNKDEFVTAGGADLAQLEAHSFQCKAAELRGLFLAGEVLNVDGITGGYNFLNAWASSWCAGTEIARDAEERRGMIESD